MSQIRPQWLRQLNEPASYVSISQNASEMWVPSLAGRSQYQLGLPENGQRLYSREDELWVRQLYDVAKSTEVSFRQKEQGVKDERQRIRRDLHDDMTQEIISLMRHAETDEMRHKAKDLMQSLKNVLSALAADTSALGGVLTEAQAQMREKLLEHGFELKWQEQLLNRRVKLSPRQVSNLLKILRESTSNVIKYAQVGLVEVSVRQSEQNLEVHVDNRIAENPRTFASNHLGIPNMQKRAQELGGYIYTVNQADEFKLLISIPLTTTGG